MCMNFFVFPREIRKIYKQGGGQNKLWRVSKNPEKNKRLPLVYFEPESNEVNSAPITEVNYVDFVSPILILTLIFEHRSQGTPWL